MHINCRLAARLEAPLILQLWQSAASWLLEKGIVQWLPDFFQLEQVLGFMEEGSDVYIAESEGLVVGTYVLTWSDPQIWGELDHDDAGYIHRFTVHRDFYGQGVGPLLLKMAEDHIKQKGKTVIRLDCMAENPKLNAFYRSNGFHFVRRLDIAGWSANLYEKK
ncbi:GNAT family N-acetyltransferase [Paenibacillus gansuensis]|uniref:GNAT family N-acetyltransferase n=1 Tax=Paenibacillus gansuensis TaxID=306542 RepID=A0ABW5PFG4_9BACL